MKLQKICKTCNKPFSISDKEQEWLKSKNLKLFEHCRHCRKRRKRKKNFQEDKKNGK